MQTSDHTGLLYRDLADGLRRSIAAGEFRPGERFASEHDLARRRKLSRVTVRRASELLVAEGLLERRPGKGLFVRRRERRLRLVHVVAGDLSWQPCLAAARGVQAAARAAGAQVLLLDAHGSVDADLELTRALPDGPADGAIIVSVHAPAFSEALCALKLRGFPFALVDQRLHDVAVPSVTADNHDGGRQVGAALLALGHRRIAFLGDLASGTVRERLEGLRDAVGDAGLPFDRSLALDLAPRERFADWSPLVDEALRALLARADRPTALFASCDAIARAAYATLAALGLRVPRDLSVVGFDDDPLAALLSPPLTSVRQPFERMGATAFELLRARVEDRTAPAEQRVAPVALVRRESCAPPPA